MSPSIKGSRSEPVYVVISVTERQAKAFYGALKKLSNHLTATEFEVLINAVEAYKRKAEGADLQACNRLLERLPLTPVVKLPPEMRRAVSVVRGRIMKLLT